MEQVRANEDGNETTLHLGDDTVPLLLPTRRKENSRTRHLLTFCFVLVPVLAGLTVDRSSSLAALSLSRVSHNYQEVVRC